ncbi:MAG: hypothetical protein NUV52_01000 [Candidatus Roizmanbacteria bacterium]|nr:hypothetical protein [Candidatus Roizmanbacteria bacterium]
MIEEQDREMNGLVANGEAYGLSALGLVNLYVETFTPYLNLPERDALRSIAAQGKTGFRIAEVISHASKGELASMARNAHRLARRESPGTALKDVFGIDYAQRVRTNGNCE